jgi:hypothetical protein
MLIISPGTWRAYKAATGATLHSRLRHEPCTIITHVSSKLPSRQHVLLVCSQPDREQSRKLPGLPASICSNHECLPCILLTVLALYIHRRVRRPHLRIINPRYRARYSGSLTSAVESRILATENNKLIGLQDRPAKRDLLSSPKTG